jgi:hypothetical protein
VCSVGSGEIECLLLGKREKRKKEEEKKKKPPKSPEGKKKAPSNSPERGRTRLQWFSFDSLLVLHYIFLF